MKDLMQIPELKKYADYDWKEITIGCSDTQVFEMSKDSDVVFLKFGEKGILTNEFIKLKLLGKYLSLPKVVFYKIDDSNEYLITSKMAGK